MSAQNGRSSGDVSDSRSENNSSEKSIKHTTNPFPDNGDHESANINTYENDLNMLPDIEKKGLLTASMSGVPIESAEQPKEDLFDREEVMKFINDAGLLSYNIRAVRISNYLDSLYKMAHFLTRFGLYPQAIGEIKSEIVQMINDYVVRLKTQLSG